MGSQGLVDCRSRQINTQPHQMDKTVDLTIQLGRKKSLTPDDAGCMDLIAPILKAAGFISECLDYKGVTNRVFWHCSELVPRSQWTKPGVKGKALVCLMHTDVVSVPQDQMRFWINHDPFAGHIVADEDVRRMQEMTGEEPDFEFIECRGVADMKANIAALVLALADYVKENPHHDGTICAIFTSDEEGDAEYGTVHVVKELDRRGFDFDYCIVAEPSAKQRLGDRGKRGARGCYHADFTFVADSPLRKGSTRPNILEIGCHVMKAVLETDWGGETEYFQPVSFNLTQVAGSGNSCNSVPGSTTWGARIQSKNPRIGELVRQRFERIVSYSRLIPLVDGSVKFQTVSDATRNGNQIELDAVFTFTGKGMHAAHGGAEARNPNHLACYVMSELLRTDWGRVAGPTSSSSFRLTSINNERALNTVLEIVTFVADIRSGDDIVEKLVPERFHEVLNSPEIKGLGIRPNDCGLGWKTISRPFLTTDGKLISAFEEACQQLLGFKPAWSTEEGTSDGWLFSGRRTQIVEFGVPNITGHQSPERVLKSEPPKLKRIYQYAVADLMGSRDANA